MIQNVLMGAGVKLIGTFINNWMHNSAEGRRSNALRDADILQAHMEMAKIKG